jgi:predicted aconitase with swiveling domain
VSAMRSVEPTIFAAERGAGTVVVGEALVSSKHFSPRYDLDRDAGTFSRPGHPLEGRSLAGKVLFLPGVLGGVAGGWTFFELSSRDRAPSALVFGRTNPVMVQGAILAGIPILDGIDPQAFAVIRDGDVIRVDPANLRVEIIERGKQ